MALDFALPTEQAHPQSLRVWLEPLLYRVSAYLLLNVLDDAAMLAMMFC